MVYMGELSKNVIKHKNYQQSNNLENSIKTVAYLHPTIIGL